MPKKYIGFTIKHKCFWLMLNLFNILASAGNAAGTVLILGREHEGAPQIEFPECQSMSVVVWMLFVLHICNLIFSLMAICGLEKRFCISYVLFGLFIFDGVVLVWSQSTYFSSQKYNCNLEMPDVYFWLMGQILYVYCLTAFVVCYFFRKLCQDPALKKLEEEEEKKEAAKAGAQENDDDEDEDEDDDELPKGKGKTTGK